MDGNGYQEIVQVGRGVTNGGCIYVIDYKGNDISGWPKVFLDTTYISTTPALADMDGDSIMEIVAGSGKDTSSFLHVFTLDGNEINNGFPFRLDASPAATPAIGDIDNDGVKDIVICSAKSLYAIGLDGSVKQGFPLTPTDSSEYWLGSPLLVDLNNDSNLEIISVVHDSPSGVYIHDFRGGVLQGWPYLFEGNPWTSSSPTVVDPLGLGEYKIYANLQGAHFPLPVLYGLNEEGELLQNFPIEALWGGEGFISVADIDNDSEFELLMDCCLHDTGGTGKIYAYEQGGSGVVDGFPLTVKGITYMQGANIGDLNNDGMLDLIVLSFSADDTIYINAWSLNVPYGLKKVLFNTFHANNARDGFIPSSGITSIKSKISKSSSTPSICIAGKHFSVTSESKIQFYSLHGRLLKEVPIAGYLEARRELAKGVFVVNVISQGKISMNLRVTNW